MNETRSRLFRPANVEEFVRAYWLRVLLVFLLVGFSAVAGVIVGHLVGR